MEKFTSAALPLSTFVVLFFVHSLFINRIHALLVPFVLALVLDNATTFVA